MIGYTTIGTNDLERARTLFDWGVDAVFSDTPGTMVPVFEKSAAEPG